MDDINALRQELTARFIELLNEWFSTDLESNYTDEENLTALARHLADEAAKTLLDLELEEEEDEPGPSESDYMREL